MTCHTTRVAIDAFDLGGPDFSDHDALHMDGCVACRTAFDRRFPPAREPVAPSRRLPILLGLALAGAALAAGVTLLSDPEPADGILLAELAPAGDLRGVPWLVGQGSDQFGDLTVVVFWEVWCHHCDAALLHVESLYDTLAADGLDVVGVTTLSKGTTQVEGVDYVEDLGLTFPQAWDRDRRVSDRFDNSAWPRAYLVRGGAIVWEGHPKELTVGGVRGVLP